MSFRSQTSVRIRVNSDSDLDLSRLWCFSIGGLRTGSSDSEIFKPVHLQVWSRRSDDAWTRVAGL